MGNKKLRREASEALKRAGYGRLYDRGTKRKILKYLPARKLRRIIFFANLRKGDLVNDCDGFNHRLSEDPEIFKNWAGIPCIDQLKFEDGKLSCGCPYGPVEPWTPEQIIHFHNVPDEWIEEQKRLGWWSDKSQMLVDRIRNCKPITDDFGIKIPLD